MKSFSAIMRRANVNLFLILSSFSAWLSFDTRVSVAHVYVVIYEICVLLVLIKKVV